MTWTLRALRPGDEGWITEACQDIEIQRWTTVPRPYTRAHAEEFVAADGLGHRTFVIARDGDERGSGMIGIHAIVDGTADVGYWVAPWARRRGAASTAVGLVVEEARREGATGVTLQIAATNEASQAVARRAGFTDTGPQGNECPDGTCTVAAHVFRLDL